MPTSPRQSLLAICIAIAAAMLPGCSSTANENRRPTGTNAGAPANDNPPAVYNRIRDARIMMHQAKSETIFIIVNRAHSGRATRQGRLAIALGDPSLSYKALTDREVDALLKSFDTFGQELITEPWQHGDERYLRAREGDIPGFRGIIVVENDGKRYKLMGRRPKSLHDALGQEKYATFSKLKQLVVRWYNAQSRAETPSGGAEIAPAGAPAPLGERR